MKKLLLITTLLLSIGAVQAQIGEIKNQGATAYLYTIQGTYMGSSITLSGGREIVGFNSNYVVVKEGSTVYLYDCKGSYIGYSISLNGGRTIKKVTELNILITDGTTVYYYDFKGVYTGHSTRDSLQ
jgi:hypothetical protein